MTTSNKSRACAGCGAPLDRIASLGTDYITHQEFPVQACDGCGLVQTGIDESTVSDAYAGYYGKRQSFFEAITNRLRERRIVRALRRDEPGTILDVGCGRGGFLARMRAAGWTATGLERPGSGYEEVWKRNGIAVKTGTWDDAEFSDGLFDVVTFWHVFEHLPSPRRALQKVSFVLKPDGMLVIAVPDIDGLQARLFKANWFHLDVPRHLFHFSLDTLSALLQQHGFTIIAVNRYSFEYDTFGAMQSALNTICRTKNLLFDFLMRRKTLGAIATRSAPRELADLALTALLTLPLLAFSLPFCVIASWAKRGGTIEVYARNRRSQPR
ncbi:MAG: class I SAM-dependent methyltransferase [Nitrospirae bacterium]|nr:class I SAM-dependent methyltransferase [Nitrospirota bacterium]